MAENFLIPILYEDDDLLVINKPAGLVVNRCQNQTSMTIQDWMEKKLKIQNLTPPLAGQDKPWQEMTPEEVFAQRSGLVHRLDKDTSGALLLAKNPQTLMKLFEQFQTHQVKKIYTCLAHGQMSVSKDILNYPIKRSTKNRQSFAVDLTGREAITEYQLLKFYSGLKLATKEQAQVYQGFSLLECSLQTGRTHQIRVHLAHINHPLVGDQLYAGRKRARLDQLWCPRQFLHESELEFTQPQTQERLTIKAPLAQDLQQALDLLIETN